MQIRPEHSKHSYNVLMRCLDANSYSRKLLLAVLFCSSLFVAGQVQQAPMTPRSTPGSPGQAPSSSDENDNDSMTRHAMQQQAERRNTQRQQDIVNDTEKLL